MTTKKTTKSAKKASAGATPAITTKAELKEFLLGIRDKMTEGVASPIYACSAMNLVLNLPDIYTMLDKANKELARDIWLRLNQSGFQLRLPPMLFSSDEEIAVG